MNAAICRYAGSHGMDIGRGPESAGVGYSVASSYQPALLDAQEQLHRLLDDVEGMLIEDNTFSVSVHYRNVAEEERPKVEQAVTEVKWALLVTRCNCCWLLTSI